MADDPTDAPRTAAPVPSRRFSEEEFAVILRKASELQERRHAEPGHRGLTLDEIRQIAAEAGIDARYVDRAVASLPGAGETDSHPFLGAPYAWRYQRTVEGRVPEDAMGQLLEAVRAVTTSKGTVEQVFGAMEWSHDDELGPLLVRVVPGDEETRIDVSARRGGEAGLVFGLGIPFGAFFTTVFLARVLGLEGTEAALSLLATGPASWFGLRALWKTTSARWERKVRRIVEGVSEAAAREARPALPGGEEDPDDGR